MCGGVFLLSNVSHISICECMSENGLTAREREREREGVRESERERERKKMERYQRKRPIYLIIIPESEWV